MNNLSVKNIEFGGILYVNEQFGETGRHVRDGVEAGRKI